MVMENKKKKEKENYWKNNKNANRDRFEYLKQKIQWQQQIE